MGGQCNGLPISGSVSVCQRLTVSGYVRKHCAGTLSLFSHADLGEVQRGDIFALGRHRLACIDATNKADVARLFDGRKPTIVVTSPPYADARNYNDPIADWDAMMMQAFNGHALAPEVQVLVNLGVIHRKNEIDLYWLRWVQRMRAQRWRHHGLYVWNKIIALPGAFGSRPSPGHEFIFHFNCVGTPVNKWLKTKGERPGSRMRNDVTSKTGIRKRRHDRLAPNDMKAPRSVFNCLPVYPHEFTGHPAQMPLEMAASLIRTWCKHSCLTYDPFGGSGTTLLACEQEGVDGLAAEISPAYVQLAIDRWRKAHPDKPVRRLS